MGNKKEQDFFIGYDAHIEDICEENSKAQFLFESETDFAVCNYRPTKSVAEECEYIKTFSEKFKKLSAHYVINNEFANWDDFNKTSDGYDWCNTPDGCHRLNLPEEYIKTLSEDENFIGIMYDEMEHVIINRNLSLTLNKKARNNLPVFPLSDKNDVVTQGELLRNQCKEYCEHYLSNGAKNFAGEHVFPVLFHTFAAAGIIPNFKSQKESYSNLQFSIAAGAALQYGTPLWNCVDLWYRNTYPGHSPNEMYHNLLFSYSVGVNRVYVEGASAFFTDGKPNEYAQKYKEFSTDKRYKKRNYSIKDYCPEIGIIRYDDTYWGQCDPFMWKKILFGNNKIKPSKTAREFTNIFNIITHGETCKNGLSWGRISPWSLRNHKSFCSMNGTAVFDDRVEKDKLTSLKLLFVCGYSISEDTLKGISQLVKDNGLTVVISKKLAPDFLQSKIKGSLCEIADGKGKWIVTNSFKKNKLKKKLSSFLGNKGEMKFKFNDTTITMKISEDGESFTLV